MIPDSICGLSAVIDGANVEEDGSVGCIVDGGYAIMEDHAKVRGSLRRLARDWGEEGGVWA